MPSELSDRAADYRARAAAHHADADVADRRVRRVERLRLAVFVGGTLGALAAREVPGAAFAIAGVAVAALGALVTRHRRAVRTARSHRLRAEVCERGEWRVLRQWDRLPAPDVRVPGEHPYAADLSIVGRASLWQLVDTVSAFPGRDALARSLLADPPSADAIHARQEAVRALRDEVAWRESLAALAADAGTIRRGVVDAFLSWTDGAPAAWATTWPYALAFVTPTVLALAAVVAAASPGARSVAALVALATVVANGAITVALRRRAAPALRAAAQWSHALRPHAALLRHAAEVPAGTPLLARHASALRAGGGAARAAARLERIAGCGELRYSPMMYVVVQAVVLWDAHVAAAAERWRRDAGAQARGWFDALGEIEALGALATVAYDNPAWTFPTIDDDAPAFDAEALGHPLIAEAARVPNDVRVGPAGSVLLVTGSNMSGKSTLLRALGVNAVLAQAGAPVCGRRLAMPRVRPMTSVVVHDALAEHTSLFLAELKRVKRVVDAARAGDAPVLYLLDEVLHGTNSAERRVATRAVLSHLLATRAIGAVSTHDLSLAADEPLASAATFVHFSEAVTHAPDGGARMTFDYRLRPGLATSTNALVLLRLMGLDAR